MKTAVKILAFLMLFGCQQNYPSNNDPEEIQQNGNVRSEPDTFETWYLDIYNFQEVDADSTGWVLDQVCDTIKFEIHGLYAPQDSIASDQFENLILVDSLKSQDFEVTSWGRGNWQEGPRIVAITLESNACQCEVHKLYYSTSIDRKYRVTERIRCKRTK